MIFIEILNATVFLVGCVLQRAVRGASDWGTDKHSPMNTVHAQPPAS